MWRYGMWPSGTLGDGGTCRFRVAGGYDGYIPQIDGVVEIQHHVNRVEEVARAEAF
jgi:hypothetical protein